MIERNHKPWNIVYIERYTTYVGAAGMLLHIHGEVEIITYVVKVRS